MTRKLPSSRREARKLLGAELRRLRELAKLRTAAMAEVIGKSAPTVSRVESGDRAITTEQVQAWLRAVLTAVPGALSADDTDYLEDLAAKATAEISPLSGTLAARQAAVAELEATAIVIRSWQPMYVPGLLQTADYARAVFTTIKAPEQVEDAVAGRLRRQVILGDSARRFEFVMAEQGLLWHPEGPDLRPAQLDRIASIAGLPHVTVRVIPLGAVMYVAPDGPFTLYEGEDGEKLVTGEFGGQRVETPEVRGYEGDLELLRRSALSGDEAIAFIRDLARQLA